MEFVLSLFVSAVMAAEGIISPLADSVPFLSKHDVVTQPTVSFGSLKGPQPKPSASPTPTPLPAILGIATTATISAAPTPTPITPHPARQKHYAIAMLGDSMTDTLGPELPHLKKKLNSLFPGTTFTLLNYGVGATNIDYGITRITNPYTYLGKDIPSLVSQSPDIVIIESFGYNPYPFEQGALDKHWLALATAVDLIRNRLPAAKIIIAVTIAPNSQVFATGAAGLSFTQEGRTAHTNTIKGYLDSTVKFAQSQDLPLADAYHPSLMSNGDGNTLYINPGDHIHYSEAGRDLVAQKIVDAILANKLLE